MAHAAAIATLSALCAPTHGVFRGREANRLGVSRNQLSTLTAAGVIERVLPNTYRMTAVGTSSAQRLQAALLWAGPTAAAAGRSAAEIYGLEGVTAPTPEIVVPRTQRIRSANVVVHRQSDPALMQMCRRNSFQVTGVEATLVALGASLATPELEIACEDARRRRLTSLSSLRAYLSRPGHAGRPGVAALRDLVEAVDPAHAARSMLEVKTRRLLVANGFGGFTREFPLRWNGRTYRFDFVFERERTILETNGRRWHDDAADYEYDNEKWSVPGRFGYRIVFATWRKVTRHPQQLLAELEAALSTPK
jgi:very-short-patch-repair endonuclease